VALLKAARESDPRIELHPPADAALRSSLAAQLGVIDPAIEPLLAYASGFRLRGDKHERDVTFGGLESGFEDAFPKSVTLLEDGCGNDWRVDVDSATGAWGRVYYVAHDPAVIVVQAESLGDFLAHVLARPTCGSPDALDSVHDDKALRIWKSREYLHSVVDLREVGDPVLASAARGVAEGSTIGDLRRAKPGEGFAWGVLGPFVKISRIGPEPVWVLQPAPRRGCLAAFLGR
jgi:hypothetical protein